ncbi:MAG: metallophosphoesterase [Methanothermobacter tenebrarum]|uniref:Metallophosphoesterase n=1 Tax=Methanothermobacter tenebrarum TaxID=680118 RepID=A0A328PAB0_9EURY|nr:metallophosphoesterase [Methanobacteriaceae archaeon]RAO79557.1 metallophosphoesterase [Methanothermobacter tenebrarum]
MKKLIGTLFLILILTLAYTLLNFHVLVSIGAGNIWLATLVSMALPLAIIGEQKFPSIFTRVLYVFSMTWLGVILFLFWTTLIVDLLKIFIYIPPWIEGTAYLLALFIGLFSIFKGTRVKVKQVEIPLEVPCEVKLVQLSDLHIGSIRGESFLESVKDIVNSLGADAVLITGDLADGSSPIDDSTLKPLKGIKAPIFFVSGNHDTYADRKKVYHLLESMGVTILDNRSIDFMGLQFVGVGYYMQRGILGVLLDQIEFRKDLPTILLHHLPTEWDTAREWGVDLQLSGHTHGGQFYPFNLIVRWMFPYFSGLYENSGSYLYVSEGTGTWGPPMRLGSSNEIVMFKFKS